MSQGGVLSNDSSAADDIETLTPDSGTSPVSPDSSYNINLSGGTNITTVGSTNTITFNLDDDIEVNSIATTGDAASGIIIQDNEIATQGTDSDIDLFLEPKGSANVVTTGGIQSPSFETNNDPSSGIAIADNEIAAQGSDSSIDIFVTPKGNSKLITKDILGQAVEADSYKTIGDTASGLIIGDNEIVAQGSDTNIDIFLEPKNGGNVLITTGLSFDSGANVLDEYEKGTWTPSLNFSGTTTGITYDASYPVGSYTLIGNCVYFVCEFVLTSKGTANPSDNAQISGLPYESSSNNYFQICRFSYLTYSTGRNLLSGRVLSGESMIRFGISGNGNITTNVKYSDFANNTAAYFNGFYYI